MGHRGGIWWKQHVYTPAPSPPPPLNPSDPPPQTDRQQKALDHRYALLLHTQIANPSLTPENKARLEVNLDLVP